MKDKWEKEKVRIDQQKNEEIWDKFFLSDFLNRYAKENFISLNPDSQKVEWVLNHLIENKRKYGGLYCPCRVPTKNIEKDRQIICPCVFSMGEIELKGCCLCKLFVKKEEEINEN